MVKRKKYSFEFQADAVKMILHEGLSIAEVSRRLGIEYSVLWRWKKKYSKIVGHKDPLEKFGTTHSQEISYLNAQLEHVTKERDILMRALSHFITQKN